MAKSMNYLISNESLHEHYGLVDILGYYNKLHAVRMERDGIVLDFRYNSLFG